MVSRIPVHVEWMVQRWMVDGGSSICRLLTRTNRAGSNVCKAVMSSNEHIVSGFAAYSGS